LRVIVGGGFHHYGAGGMEPLLSSGDEGPVVEGCGAGLGSVDGCGRVDRFRLASVGEESAEVVVPDLVERPLGWVVAVYRERRGCGRAGRVRAGELLRG
jgi:hypothetical protein